MAAPNGQFLGMTLLGVLACVSGIRVSCDSDSLQTKSVYDFSAMDIYENENISFLRYSGDVLAIINLATYCGYTRPHYVGMNALTTEFLSAGFKVLGFPCNNFNMLEPGINYTDILNGIKYVRPGGGFIPSFQMFKKIDVNGKNEHPLYTYLKSMCGPTSDKFSEKLFYAPKRVSDVRWNFEVFLIDRKGKPLYRYSPDAPISDIECDIKELVRPGRTDGQTELIVQPIVESSDIPVDTDYEETVVVERTDMDEEKLYFENNPYK